SILTVVMTGVIAAPAAEAAIVSVGSLNVGPVFFLDPLGPEATAGFLIGENVLLDFTFDDTTPDDDAAIGSAQYNDPNSVVTLTGETSGASVVYAPGIELEFDNNEELEIDDIGGDADAVNTPLLEGDIDFNTLGTPFFTDVDNLALSLFELNTIPFPNQTDDTATTTFFNGVNAVDGMRFGPVPAVPEPSTTLGAIALGGGFLWKRRKRRSSIES
ncbi:MAG: PEP-CTERM sorting domain-containing protein, partial [Cyanobacteria bacterium J06648_11]